MIKEKCAKNHTENCSNHRNIHQLFTEMEYDSLLPEEILVNIFQYLSPKAIKTCSLVCKRFVTYSFVKYPPVTAYRLLIYIYRWDTIISNSRQVMKKFQLNLEESENMINHAKFLKRKHQTIKLKNLSENSLHVISLHNLNHVQLSCCKVEPDKLTHLLKSLPQLEKFHAKAVDFLDDVESCNKVEVKLKELRLEYCDIDIVDFFDTSSLRIFEVSSLLTEECDNVIELLKNQKDLQQLGIGGIVAEHVFNSPEICKFQFHLKSLNIDKASMKNDQNEALFKFLLQHKNTLTSLKILYPIDNTVYQFILSNLRNLQHLEIPVTTFSQQSPDYFMTLAKNHTESVKFFGIFKNLNNAKLVLNVFNNLQYLDLSQITTNNWFMDLLLQISKTFRNLFSLKIPNLFNQPCHQNINFPKLKEFSVAKIYDDTVYNPFIRRHSDTLENIFIGWTDDNFIKGLTVEEIMNCFNLKHVTICSYSPLVTKMFNKVSTRKQPWILESRVKMALDLDYIKLIFKFPDDKAVWDDRCRVWSDELIREFSTVENYGLNAFVNKYK